ncbi:MAG TPA: peroxiredoxin [Steroidobacteraceae bacterium]|nr:peroxiredoxin [Steroidobacteraceae bacterium]
MLAMGARAPEFTLPDQDGQSVSLSTLLGHGSLILYFYPADFTPGCTREACALRDLHGEILAAGLTVAGVSPQDSATHRAFREKHRLPFTLLSDVDKFVIRMYEVRGPLGFGVRRGTYLIDQARYIRGAVLADFRIAEHEDFVRKAVALSASGATTRAQRLPST